MALESAEAKADRLQREGTTTTTLLYDKNNLAHCRILSKGPLKGSLPNWLVFLWSFSGLYLAYTRENLTQIMDPEPQQRSSRHSPFLTCYIRPPTHHPLPRGDPSCRRPLQSCAWPLGRGLGAGAEQGYPARDARAGAHGAV
jgi:hypothetical protein